MGALASLRARHQTEALDWNRLSNQVSSIGGRDWLQVRHLLPLLRRYSSEIEGAVLDLGCGSSPFRSLFPKAHRYIRVDRYRVDPEVVVADATAIPLGDGAVDCVLLSQVIGDVPDLVALFKEIDRVLAPEGKVLIYETTSYPQHDTPHDCWRVLPAGLKWAAEKAGLEVAAVHYLGGYFTQLGIHWNMFLIGPLDRLALLRPLFWLARAGGNLALAGLDAASPRPTLASDYLACLVKRKA